MAIAALFFAGTFNANATAVQTMPTNVQSFVTSATVTFIQEEEGATAEEPQGWHQALKQRFIEGGPGFMGIVLLCLILGLAIAIERIIFLNLSTTNTNKLARSVEDALNSGGVEAAKEVCRNTKGPVASIYYQGLDRADESIEAAEKAVIGYGVMYCADGLLQDRLGKVVGTAEDRGDELLGLVTHFFQGHLVQKALIVFP